MDQVIAFGARRWKRTWRYKPVIPALLGHTKEGRASSLYYIGNSGPGRAS